MLIISIQMCWINNYLTIKRTRKKQNWTYCDPFVWAWQAEKKEIKISNFPPHLTSLSHLHMLLKTSLFWWFLQHEVHSQRFFEEIYKEASLAIVNRFSFFSFHRQSTVKNKLHKKSLWISLITREYVKCEGSRCGCCSLLAFGQ